MKIASAVAVCLLVAPASAQQSSTARCRLNVAAYEALQMGDTLEQARNRVGCRGAEQARSAAGGITITMHSWQAGMKIISAMFQDGRLASKSQVGLDD